MRDAHVIVRHEIERLHELRARAALDAQLAAGRRGASGLRVAVAKLLRELAERLDPTLRPRNASSA